VISRRIAAAVFFLRSQRILGRAYATDLLTDVDQFPAELLIGAELSDLLFGLAHGDRSG